jgi:hypothetical protein
MGSSSTVFAGGTAYTSGIYAFISGFCAYITFYEVQATG